MIKRLIAEPLLHFLVGASLIFLLFMGNNSDSDPNTIRITQSKIQSIKQGWKQRWGRVPTKVELEGLITNAIHGEAYYREALRLGLDRGDTVVKNRLIQKMKYMRNEANPQPTKEQLKNWFADNRARYPDKKLYSFKQAYLGTSVTKDQAELIATRLNLSELSIPEVEAKLQLPRQMLEADAEQISRRFGHEFSDSLKTLKQDGWVGPVRSGFGAHLVWIERVHTIRTSLELAGIKEQLVNDWLNEQRVQAERKSIESLLNNYQVEVEGL